MTESRAAQKHWFLHVDLDAFFASVEQLDNPQYRGKPLIVGGKPEDRRGVVSTASYEARKFGVHSAMPVFQAKKLCPDGIFVHPRMARYEEISYQIMQIFRDYSPDVEQMSIDEAFIDLTGTEMLFGPPELTAQKIKERVKKETGLTVSIGLSRTKYIAKMASGYKKPDGFFFVQPEKETDFMLSVPLNKVWGIGQKTLEMLNKGGIYTTKDILERDYETLEFQFGSNTASFLYDIMHNGGNNVFKTERKSHSISAERTYPYDLTDSEIALTALMQLCHEVMFRLLREESYSHTVMLKMRYSDFKTITVQKTFDTQILTLDSLFEAVKSLFESKYSEGDGIRLLGVGFENVTKDEKPTQQLLFDDGSKKKQAIEKTILNLEKKHPEIKIQKARTISGTPQKLKCTIFFLTLIICGTKQAARAQNYTQVQAEGAGTTLPDVFPSQPEKIDSGTLYNWELNDDKHVSFSLKGYWQGLFEGSLLWSFGGSNDKGQDPTQISFSPAMPVFKQAVDLSAIVNLDNTWFFEAKFADEFKKNTYAISYKGSGYLREARLSNRGIFMKSDYSAEYFGYALKGGENQAPGLSLHFEDFLDNKWAADFILRYDMTKTMNASFYGMNSATDIHILPCDFMYGSRYVFPESAASALVNIKDIYVENPGGDYRDKSKKKYKKLSNSDYQIIESKSMIILAASACALRTIDKTPSVLVTFHSKADFDFICAETGKYSDSESFAGKVQEVFDPTRQKIDLSKYAGADGPVTTEIDGNKALVIQNSNSFSPYICASYYDLGLSKEADISVIYRGSEKECTEFSIEQVSDEFSGVKDDFFAENHYYARLFSKSSTKTSLQLAENRFPLADWCPEVYLNRNFEYPVEILLRTYTPVSEFLIGTNAAAGTVMVYKNGILDSGAKYYSDTGRVELSSTVGTTDKIYILWQEDNSNFTGGSISSGAGFIYNILPELKADAALTATWPLSAQEKYSTQDNLKNGFAALSAGLSYTGKNINLTEQIATSLNTQNAAGALLVKEGQDFVPKDHYFSSSSGFTTKTAPYIIIENPEQEIILKESDNGTILKHSGETESGLQGYKIPLSWDFSSISGTAWAAVDIKLSAGNAVASSKELEFDLKTDFPSAEEKSFNVYLQLGIKAESSFSGEDSELISSWKLTAADGASDANVITTLVLSKKGRQKVRIRLSDKDRSRLSSNHDARLVVVQTDEGKAAGSNTGKIYALSYKPYVQSIFADASEAFFISTTSRKTSSPSKSELKKDENFSSVINWELTEKSSITKESMSKITAVSYFKESDFSSYENINFDFIYKKSASESSPLGNSDEDSAKFTFILDNSPDSKTDEGNLGIKLEVYDISDFISENENWNTLTISLSERKAFINSREISNCDLYINSKNIPSRMKIVFDTIYGSEIVSKGCFFVDNLYYSNASIYLTAVNHTKLELKKEGSVLTHYGKSEFPLIKDAVFTIESSQAGSSAVINKASDSQKTGSVSSNASANVTITGIELSTQVQLESSSTATDSNILKNAGHGIKTDNSVIKVLSFEENYRFSHDDKKLKKQNSLSLDFNDLNIPVKISVSTSAQTFWSTQSQTSDFELAANPGIFDFSQTARYSQKINTKKNNSKTFDTNNYFEGWRDITEFEFSTGEDYAIFRNEAYTSKASVKLPFAAMKPTIAWNIEGQTSSSSDALFTDSSGIIFELPFQIENNSFKFKASKSAGGTKDIQDIKGSYFSDTKNAFEEQNKRDYLFTTIPFYDLFQPDLKAKVADKKTDATQKLSYSTKYEAYWNRRLFNSPKDIFVPSFTSLAVSRDISASVKESDVYQFKTSLTNNSINNFGREGFMPFFSWYNQDEIMTSLTGIVKLPSDAPENTTFLIAAYAQVLFYIDSTNTIKTALDGSLATNLDYNGKTTLIWQHAGVTTPAVEIAKTFSKKARQTDFKISRKETVNFEISKENEVRKQTYSYSHSVEAEFAKFFTVTTSLGGEFKYISTSANILSLTLSIGGKAEF